MIYVQPSIYINPLVDESGSSLKGKLLTLSHIFKKGKKSSCSQKPQVTFFDTVAIRETIHLRDYTADERRRSWYNKRELKEIKHQLKRTLVSIQVRRHKIDTDFDCRRGLECRVGKKAIQRQRRISHALMIVLSEQEDQRMLGTFDPVTISLAYRHVSRVSAAKAYEIGLRDELEACRESYASIDASKEVKEVKRLR
jgi:hypothetical protein